MNTRALTLAIVIAGLAMMMVYTYIEDQKSAMIKEYGVQSSVVVAKNDIQELDLIDDSKVEVKTVPANFLSPGHFKTIKELEKYRIQFQLLETLNDIDTLEDLQNSNLALHFSHYLNV